MPGRHLCSRAYARTAWVCSNTPPPTLLYIRFICCVTCVASARPPSSSLNAQCCSPRLRLCGYSLFSICHESCRTRGGIEPLLPLSLSLSLLTVCTLCSSLCRCVQ